MNKMVQVLVVAVLTVSFGSAMWLASTIAQEAAPAAARPNVGDDEAGRLPPGYTVVVTRDQRAKIYTIQDTYQKQIDALKKQIAEIEGQRDNEIESLMDDEQKKIIAYVLKLRERERQQNLESSAPEVQAPEAVADSN
jgi:TolA-binding protein